MHRRTYGQTPAHLDHPEPAPRGAVRDRVALVGLLESLLTAKLADHDQREGLGGTHAYLHLHRRGVPTRAGGRTRRRRLGHPDGRAGRGASSNDLYSQFDYAGDPQDVVIDLTRSHVWDASTVAALDSVEAKYARKGKRVQIRGLNEPSVALHDRLTGILPTH